MDKKLEIGDEVLIFTYIPSWGPNQNYKRFLRGKVVSYELSDDISHHGSAQYVTIYTVIDEDGNKHYGNYYDPIIGDSFFMTKEDYINYLEKVIASNNNEIRDIKRKNRKIRKRINSFNKQGVVSSKNNGGK